MNKNEWLNTERDCLVCNLDYIDLLPQLYDWSIVSHGRLSMARGELSLRLHELGATWQEVAYAMGTSSRSSVHSAAIRFAYHTTPLEPAT